jgi:hypothetical protein
VGWTYHADKESGLLSISSYTSITHDTNCKASSKTSKANRKTSAELDEPLVEGHTLFH